MLGAFGLSWRLRDVPLRETAASTGAESFAAPREASPSYGEHSYRRVVGDDDQVPSDDDAASSHLAKTG